MNNVISNNKNLFRELEEFGFSSRTTKNNEDVLQFKGKRLINFSSNDYLGLSKNKDIIATSCKWLKKYGSSLSSSRLISGNLDRIKSIEKQISDYNKHEESIILGNGFLLNSTVIPALIGNSIGKKTKSFIFSDKSNHASINYGCLVSRQKCFRYNHLDLNHLERNLKKIHINEKKIIISETLFSMDGDLADIDGLKFLSNKYNSILYLDEAHATGVCGVNGFGLSSNYKKNENEVIVGTFSKAFGSYGSYISCSKKNHKIIVNYCGGLIYSTVLPPSVLGSIFAGVKKIPKSNHLRIKIKRNYEFLLRKLKDLSYDTSDSNSHIIPIILYSHANCKKLHEYLFNNGFYAKVIRPPTVPKGKERIRLSITATMNKKMLVNFAKKLSEFKT